MIGKLMCKKFKDVSDNEYDFIIIGSGMYGGYTATKLAEESDYKARILVVERGPFLAPVHWQNIPGFDWSYFKDVAHFPFNASTNGVPADFIGPEQSCVGGKSLSWGKWSPRLRDSDLELWPSCLALEMDKLYNEVEHDMNIVASKEWANNANFQAFKPHISRILGSEYFGVELPPIALEASTKHSGMSAAGAYSSLPGMLEAALLSEKKNNGGCVHIVPDTPIVKALKKNKQVTGLVIKWAEAHTTFDWMFKGSPNVILAAGMAASTTLAKGLLPDNPIIGAQIDTHLRANLGIVFPKDAVSDLNLPDSLEPTAFHINAEHMGRQFHYQLTIGATLNEDAETVWYSSRAGKKQIEDARLHFESDMLACKIYLIAEKQCTGSHMQWAEQWGKPNVNWLMSNEDQQFFDDITQKCLDFLEKLANGKVEKWLSKWPWQEVVADNVSTFQNPISASYHEAGTMPIGLNAATSVLDTGCKFHDLDNLWCVDQSGFCSVGSANPVPTGMALSLKASKTMATSFKEATSMLKVS